MSDGLPHGDEDAIGGSGGNSIAGYEYQIDVSVWLALDLVVSNRLAQELVLEPASEEDIEADLAENEPGRLTTTAALDGYRLIVQAKLRSGDAWTVPAVKALLKHGKARPSAADRLKDPKARYLLVTTAALNGETQGLRVRRPGNRAKIDGMPSSLIDALPANSAGRVAIIGNEDVERIATDIRTLLAEAFRVPNARLGDCKRALREAARARICGAGGGRWTRADLEQVIRRHDGHIASSQEMDRFVHPTNWGELRSAISKRNAALLIGQSGTGKTAATLKLYEELREEVPGLTRVPIKFGPAQLRDDKTEPPVLYDIEDPWGRYDFDPGSRPWNDQLAQAFATARPDRMIIATTRLDVAQSAGALDTVRQWRVGLEAEHYGGKERGLIYRTRIEALPRKLRPLASNSEALVLAELATPLEIHKFFDALGAADLEQLRHPGRLVSEAIRRAHQDSIERTVIDQVEQRGDVRAAAVLWGLLKANDRFSLLLVQQLEDMLAEHGSEFERGVSGLVAFFVAARNLRQAESTVTYYHPRVEAGIEQALARGRVIARRTLGLLIDILVSPAGPGEAWGVAASARMLLATDRTPALKPLPSAPARAKIDDWLAGALSNGGKEFEANLALAAAAGSVASNVSEIARFLLHRPDHKFRWMNAWGPPEHDEAWYVRMRGDPTVKAVVATFVREVLPRTRDDFDQSFVGAAERVAPGLTPAFLAAAAEAVRYGVISSHRAIAKGALDDLGAFEAVVDKAIEVRAPSEADRLRATEIHLACANGEYSDDYAEHLAEDDDGYTAGEFLEAYVEHVRATVGWRHLVGHRHRASLLRCWLRALANDGMPAADEVAGAFDAVLGTTEEDVLWQVLVTVWDPVFEQALVNRVMASHDEAEIRVAALACLAERASGRLPAICRELAREGRHGRLVEIAVELGEMRRRQPNGDEMPHGEAAERAATLLTPDLKEISDAALALRMNAAPVLSEDALGLLARVVPPSEELRLFRVVLDGKVLMSVPDDVRWLLANSDVSRNTVEGIEAAIRHDMKQEIEAGLSHRFAHVVARSMRAVAVAMATPLPESLLALAHHKGSPVRQALVELLEARPHPRHLPAMVLLARDDWSSRSAHQEDTADYPIARAAVAAIGKLCTLDDATADDLHRLAIDTSDPEVRFETFVLLVRAAHPRFQALLFDLAVAPGRRTMRVAAAGALLVGRERVTPETVGRISPQLLEMQPEEVVSRLLLLCADRGEIDDVVKVAETLSTKENRRVLLLLAIVALRDRDMAAAERISRMLPVDHAGVKWALADAADDLDENALEDLGDPTCVSEVLLFIQPENGKG